MYRLQFYAWEIVGAFLMVLIWFLPWRFQTNDDEVMMWLVSGAYTGQPESFAVFLHPVLSWLLSVLYVVIPGQRWYPILWFLILYCSYCGGLGLIRRQMSDSRIQNVWAMLMLAFLVHFTFFLQFSVVAAISVSMGIGLRVAKDSQEKVWHFYPSDCLILVGFLVRPEVLLLYLLGIASYTLVFQRRLDIAKKLTLPMGIYLIGMGVSVLWIQENKLSGFVASNRLRSQVFDHPMLQLQKEEIKALDLGLYHFANGLIHFQEDDTLVAKLPSWKEFLDKRRGEALNLKFYRSAFSTYIENERFLIAWMTLVSILAVLCRPKKAILLLASLLGLVILAAPVYLLKVQIYAILSLFFILALMTEKSSRSLSRTFKFIWIALLSVLLAMHFYSFSQSHINLMSGAKLRSQVKSLDQKGRVFLVGKSAYYHDLVFDNPLNFKIMGWPTLLEVETGKPKNYPKFYLVDSATYFNNREYFDGYEQGKSQTNLILLRPR